MLSKHGFNIDIKNVQHLDAIYELVQGKYTFQKIGYKEYVVFNDSILNDERIKEHQKYLYKKFYTYKCINWNNDDALFASEYLKKKQSYEGEQRRKELKNKQQTNKEKRRMLSNRGIYGIYCNNKLIYIGKTNVSFEQRFKQHKDAIDNNEPKQSLHTYIIKAKQNGAVIEMKPIINILDLKVKGNITDRDLQAMELALIQLYQPICNVEGINKQYEFR